MKIAMLNIGRVGMVVGGCNAIGYAVTALLETHKITDLVGAGSFVAATAALVQKNNIFANPLMFPKLTLVNLGIMLWGTRLAMFLFKRVLQVGEDKRLSQFFRKPGEGYLDAQKSFFPVKLGVFWVLQAAWGILCLLPVSLLNSIPAAHPSSVAQSLLSLTGHSPLQTGLPTYKPAWSLIFWRFIFPVISSALRLLPVVGIFLGIAVEAVADAQKNTYRNDKQNEGHWCDRGLWTLSRHPNCK
jgi:steroid 5-alpha reductase family enzyme